MVTKRTNPQEPNDAKKRRVLTQTRGEGGADDHEVEDVPAVAKKVLRARAVCSDADRDLGHEDAEKDLIDGCQEGREAIRDVVGLNAERDRIENDHDKDEALEAA